ncbi:MAG: YjbQ family protein [Rhodospirillaceae bacterium]|nr:YjbQ family protein [Rhodospirillales bacterium]
MCWRLVRVRLSLVNLGLGLRPFFFIVHGQPLDTSFRNAQLQGCNVKQAHSAVTIRTQGQGLTDITARVAGFVRTSGIRDGLLTLFIQHTSASLTIQENADPDVLSDLNDFFRRVVKEDPNLYRHTTEGSDDMPAHIRAALTNVQISIPVLTGSMVLGTWQGIYVFEHRARPHDRQVVLHLSGT